MLKQRSVQQAYHEIPWRAQLQRVLSTATFGLVIVAMSFLQVTLNAEISSLGRDIQRLQIESTELRESISSTQSELAYLTSIEIMSQRADEMGFRPIQSSEAVYIVVPGYDGRPSYDKTITIEPVIIEETALPDEYTETLIEWIRGQVYFPPREVVEALP